MSLRIEPNARSKAKATAWTGPIMAATFFRDGQKVTANVIRLATPQELRELADELEAWGHK